MYLLHQIGDRKHGSNFNTLEEILASKGPISFDGIYESVYQNYKALKGKDITFFVIGKYIGADNTFDVGQPFSRFCTIPQILEMKEYLGAKLGYHSWSHAPLDNCNSAKLEEETRSIHDMFIEGGFAYPGGVFSPMCVDMVASRYPTGWSVTQGDDRNWTRRRKYLNW